MYAYYSWIKLLHIAAVACSGVLFLARGLAAQRGHAWPLGAIARRASASIDSILLAAAVALAVLIHQYPFTHGWLTLKLALLVLYIALGTLALRRGKTAAIRRRCLIAAIVSYIAIVAVAVAHVSFGWLGAA